MKLIFVNINTDQAVIDFVYTKSLIEDTLPFKYITNLDFGIPVYNLFPKKEILHLLKESVDGDSNTLEFDKQYYTQIFTDKDTFIDFMKIIKVLESQEYTFVLTNYDDEYYVSITDALIKVIQLRYSIQSYIIQNREDIDENDFKPTNFNSPEGYQNYIKDISQYTLLTDNDILLNTTKELMEKNNNIERDMDLLDQLMEDGSIKELHLV